MSYFIIIRGPLGCGKTTIAKKLATCLAGKYFSVDKILDAHKLGYDTEGGNIAQKSFLKTNEILAPQAKKFLAAGQPVIFDGNFYWRSHIKDLIKKLNAPHCIFTLHAPLPVCIERDKKRKKTYGIEATKAVYKRSIALTYGTVIDTTKTKNEAIEQIIALLRKRKILPPH